MMDVHTFCLKRMLLLVPQGIVSLNMNLLRSYILELQAGTGQMGMQTDGMRCIMRLLLESTRTNNLSVFYS